MDRNIVEYRGSFYEVKINAGKSLWARKLTKDLTDDIRVRYDKSLPANKVQWLSGSLNNVKKSDW